MERMRVTPSTTVTSGTSLKIVVQVFPAYAGSVMDTDYTDAYSQVYTRTAGNTWPSAWTPTRPRRNCWPASCALNDANINQLNDSTWINGTTSGVTNKDLLIGGTLQLAMMTYFYECDHGESIIAGLAEAVPIYNVVASGVAGGDTTLQTLDSVLQSDLQFPCLPQGMGIDVPSNYWGSVSITGDTSEDMCPATF